MQGQIISFQTNLPSNHRFRKFFTFWWSVENISVRSSIFHGLKINKNAKYTRNIFNMKKFWLILKIYDNFLNLPKYFWQIKNILGTLFTCSTPFCRFMHNFIVDCRFASLIVDVDFHQKAIVDCRQKGHKGCDLHLIRTPPSPPSTAIRNHYGI